MSQEIMKLKDAPYAMPYIRRGAPKGIFAFLCVKVPHIEGVGNGYEMRLDGKGILMKIVPHKDRDESVCLVSEDTEVLLL